MLFVLASDALDFVAQVLEVLGAMEKWHAAIATVTDSSLSATTVAALLGCVCAAPKAFLREDETERCLTYKKCRLHAAVSAAIARYFPTQPFRLG